MEFAHRWMKVEVSVSRSELNSHAKGHHADLLALHVADSPRTACHSVVSAVDRVGNIWAWV